MASWKVTVDGHEYVLAGGAGTIDSHPDIPMLASSWSRGDEAEVTLANNTRLMIRFDRVATFGYRYDPTG